jgi:hypothetical protein
MFCRYTANVLQVYSGCAGIQLICGHTADVHVFSGCFSGIQLMFCKFVADIMQVCSGYYAGIQRMFCRYIADILQVYSGCYADIQRMFCRYIADVLQVRWSS